MENLQQLLNKVNDISATINALDISGTNGVNTMSDKIASFKEHVKQDNFEYTKFHAVVNKENTSHYDPEDLKKLEIDFVQFKKDIPSIQEKVGFDLLGELGKLVEKADFFSQWEKLDNEDKTSLLYFDKDVYKILRSKIDAKDFNFLFEGFADDEISYPDNIAQWMHASANSKVLFYKLRKEAQGTLYEDFFNSQSAMDAESGNSSMRIIVATDYLKNKAENEKNDASWYDRLDMQHNKHWAFSYTYYFFKKLEDEITGYDKVKENIKLPVILRKWAGQVIDEDAFRQEMTAYNAEVEGLDYRKHSEVLKKYPLVQLSQKLQDGLSKNDFLNLKAESKNTEFEEFFSHPATQLISTSMPYKRIEHMFVYFRDKFTNDSKKKFKP